MIATDSEATARLAQIQRTRALRVLGGAASAVVLSGLLFASFAIGHATGPTPLRPIEWVAGSLTAVIVGLVVGLVTAPRRRNAGHRWRVVVHEGSKRRQIYGFDDFIVIDDEVILRRSVVSVEHHGARLVLRYQELTHNGRMLREFEGQPSQLAQLAQALA